MKNRDLNLQISITYLFIVFAYKGDGIYSESEGDKITELLSKYADESVSRAEIVNWLDQATTFFKEDNRTENANSVIEQTIEACCNIIKDSFSKEQHRGIIDDLIEIAKADGVYDNSEKNWIGQISDQLGLLDSANVAEDEDEDLDKGYPMMRWRKMEGLDPEEVSKYVVRWQCPSVIYNGRMGITMLVDECIPEFQDDNVAPVFSESQIHHILTFMRERKVIPILSYAPSKFFEVVKHVWWFHPFVIWKEDTASFIFIDKNGIHALYPENGQISFLSPWERISYIEFEQELSIDFEDEDQNVNRLTVHYDNGAFLTFDEFIWKNGEKKTGSYLSIIEEIWNLRYETIEASRGAHSWKEGSGGEGLKDFQHPMDLLDESKWEDAYYPDPRSFI